MEVIQLDDDDDDFIQSVNPTATRKSNNQPAASSKATRVSKRPPPISTRIDSDPILKASTSSASLDEDECPICGRNLKLLNEQRRTHHLNSCLDDGEAKTDLDKNMEKWKSTMDCPVCKTPLAAGPFRSAHIKKCGREHAINGRDLLNLVNTQEKVTETRRKRALPHTSAKTPKLRPKKVSKLDGEPKSMAEEEILMAKALSVSMMEQSEIDKEEEERKKKEEEKRGKQLGEGVSPQFTRIINENIRKRRSYAVVELAPRGCRCDVFELIQSRFLRVFQARRKILKRDEKARKEKEKKKEEEEGVKERLAEGEKRTLRRAQMEATMANALARLDSLSWAYRNLVTEGEQKGDVSIECRGGQIRAFSWALFARTSALGRTIEENAKLSIDQPTTVVRHWIQYVHCARIEWAAGEENEGMMEIAKQHGPEGLVEECVRMTKTRREYRGFGRIGVVMEEDTTVPPKDTVPVEATIPAATTVPTDATVPPEETPEEEAEVEPLPSDDARVEENEDDEEANRRDTIDSEGSMNDALKKCAADKRAGARLSSPRPPDGSFLAALQASPIIEITVATPTTIPPPEERSKDSFLESIVYGETPKRSDEAPPPTVLPPATVVQPTDSSESTESMDESDAMRNILDVSCLRRSPMIRVEGEREEERRKEIMFSPELFNDSDDFIGQPVEMSQKVPSLPRRSPRRSLSQSIPAPSDTVTPTTSRCNLLRKSILGQKKEQEVIYLDDTPMSSPVTVAVASTVLIEKKEEPTVDESFPRMDQPSYGQGGLDTVDGGVEERNGDDPMEGEEGEDYHYERDDYDDNIQCHWDNNGYEEMEGEGDVASRAQEEVDSFLQSLRFNETSPKGDAPGRPREEVDSFLKSLRFNDTNPKTASPAKGAPSTDEVDSFLLSMRRIDEEPSRDDEEDRDEGTGDILGALSPVRRETESAFKTPTVRGGRGRGRGRGGRGGAVFGSHVKVLKWSNVTPKPRFDAMDDASLKAQLARYGLRPMGRKRAIAMLSEIYEQTHPVVDESAAGPSSSSCSTDSTSAARVAGGGDISPTRRPATVPDEEEENDGEKTLNRGAESSDEENSERGGGVGEAEESMIIPKGALKGVDNQLVLFLEWLRAPTQKDLYDHCLSLKSISLEELEVKLKRADSALCGISKKVLMCVLDRLHITYSLPNDGWKRKNKGK